MNSELERLASAFSDLIEQLAITPAKAGVQDHRLVFLDTGFRRYDMGGFRVFI
jgi:hypothetical protein